MYREVIASTLSLLLTACTSLQNPTPTVNGPGKLKPRANESLAMIVPEYLRTELERNREPFVVMSGSGF